MKNFATAFALLTLTTACCPDRQEIDDKIKEMLPVLLPGYKSPTVATTGQAQEQQGSIEIDQMGGDQPDGQESPDIPDNLVPITLPSWMPQTILEKTCKSIAQMVVDGCVNLVIQNPDWEYYCGDADDPDDVQPIKDACQALYGPTFEQCMNRKPIMVPKDKIPDYLIPFLPRTVGTQNRPQASGISQLGF